MLENVPEFVSWGPVSRLTGKPIRRKRVSRSVPSFVSSVASDTLSSGACCEAAITERRRLASGCSSSPGATVPPFAGRNRRTARACLQFRTAAECIDFSLPCPSIFLTSEEAKALGKILGRRIIRPLKFKTMRRIARGVYRFVIDAAEPFIIPVTARWAMTEAHGGIEQPLRTITRREPQQ
jgi:DNA (cytosine-5)-methyltransferase 1